MLKNLTFETAAHLLSKLVDMGDSYYRYGESLADSGFTAFQSNLQLFEGLAKDEAELNLHRTLEIERLKEEFADPFAICFELAGREAFQTPYVSKILEELRVQNEPNPQLRRKPEVREREWQLLMGPCRRAFEQLDYAAQAERKRLCRESFSRLRAKEIERLLPCPHHRARYNDKDATNLANETLGNGLARFGFSVNPKLTPKKMRSFTKPLVGDWVINIVMLEDRWGYDGYSYDIVNGVRQIGAKHAEFHMDLRLNKQKALYPKELGSVPMNIAAISPLGKHAYTTYNDMDEMVVGLQGYIELYGLLANELETRLIAGLTEL